MRGGPPAHSHATSRPFPVTRYWTKDDRALMRDGMAPGSLHTADLAVGTHQRRRISPSCHPFTQAVTRRLGLRVVGLVVRLRTAAAQARRSASRGRIL